MNRRRIIWGIAYTACIGAVVMGLSTARKNAVATYGGQSAVAEWQAWRDAVNANDDGPVRRRPPKSDLPPAYVLMRDHYGACLGFSLILTSALFATTAFVVNGVLQSSRPIDPAEPS